MFRGVDKPRARVHFPTTVFSLILVPCCCGMLDDICNDLHILQVCSKIIEVLSNHAGKLAVDLQHPMSWIGRLPFLCSKQLGAVNDDSTRCPSMRGSIERPPTRSDWILPEK